MSDQRPRQGRRRRRLTLGNLLLLAGALVILTPLAYRAYEAIMWRLEVYYLAPTPTPAQLSPAGDALAQSPAPPTLASDEHPNRAEPPGGSQKADGTGGEEFGPTEALPATGELSAMQFHRNRGVPVYQLEIPRLGVKYLVGEGIDDPVLAKGPAHYAQTALPGEMGNAAIAGHRTIRGRPAFFYDINQLQTGDPLLISYRDKRLRYEVERVFLTTPYDLSVLDPTPYSALTLTTCDPPGSDERRLIVRARLVAVTDVSE